MSNQPLEFEEPHSPDRGAFYGKPKDVEFWIRNPGSERVLVESVTLHMQPDQGCARDLGGLEFRKDVGVELPGGGREHVSVGILPPLYCLAHSNYLDVSAQVRPRTARKPRRPTCVVREQFSWVLLREPAPAPGVEVFISFADPEDLPLASLAKTYLARAGLTGYIASDDTRPGCDMWSEKIEPAIKRSIGTLVLWTPNTVAKPDKIRREIRFSRQIDVPVALFRGSNAHPPAEYPGAILEYVKFDTAAPQLEFAKGIASAAQQWRTTGRFP